MERVSAEAVRARIIAWKGTPYWDSMQNFCNIWLSV